MRFISKRALVALVAVLALSAASAASASAALPEFGGSTFPVQYTFSSSGGVTFKATDAGSYVICTGGTAEGEITGAKTLTARFDFKGCYYADNEGGGMACTTKGASVGEIKSESLKGSLVYISKANKEVGIVFNPYEQAKELKEIVPPSTFAASFVCAERGAPSIGIAIRNGVTVPVTSLNTLTKSYTLKFAVSENKQVPAEYENAAGEKVRNLLETSFREESFATGGMETAGTLNMQKSIEVKG
jgi:hypothetical protein